MFLLSWFFICDNPCIHWQAPEQLEANLNPAGRGQGSSGGSESLPRDGSPGRVRELRREPGGQAPHAGLTGLSDIEASCFGSLSLESSAEMHAALQKLHRSSSAV
jgi:hypothetical protein